MARGRKGTAGFSAIDEFVMAYLDLEEDDRPRAMAAIRGAELGMQSKQVRVAGVLPTLPAAEKGTFEDVGRAIAEEA